MTLFNDIRLTLRGLRRAPGFTTVTVLTLALGIGANTAIFSVINAMLLRPLPYSEPERLVRIDESGLQASRFSLAYPTVKELRGLTQDFASVAAYTLQRFNFTGQGDPQEIGALFATADLFQTLGSTPALGRTFTTEEERAHLVVLSHGLWATSFGSDPGVLGKNVTLDGVPYTVIGVMPASFRFPNDDVLLWTPIGGAFASDPGAETNRDLHFFNAVARLTPGATPERINGDLATLSQRIEGEAASADGNRRSVRITLNSGGPPGAAGGRGPQVESGPATNRLIQFPLTEDVVGNIRPMLYVLFGTVILVLLIACANAANLLVARANARRKEIVIRQALGAGRGHIARHILTESVLLSLMGGLVGIWLSYWGLELLLARWPASLPRVHDVGIDRAVLGFTMLISVATGIGFGALPAIRGSNPAIEEALREEAGSSSGSRRRQRAQRSLVVAQLALALVLLVGAGLLVRSFVRLLDVDPGYDTRSAVAARIRLTPSRYATPEARTEFFRGLTEDLASRPGVTSVSLSRTLPLSGSLMMIAMPIRSINPDDPDQVLPVALRLVSPEYFKTMRISLVEGRSLESGDRANAPPVIVINSKLAKRFWPNQDAIGKQLPVDAPDGGDQNATVVGVVGDIHYTGLSDDVMPEVYVPLEQSANRGDQNWVIARVGHNPLEFSAAIREVVRRLDPTQPIADLVTLDQMVDRSTAARRFNMVVITLFAGLAFLLALIGIYGVTAYSVSQRTQELGIRVALGASPGDVSRLLLNEGLKLAGIGALAGGVLAVVASRALASMVYGVAVTDAITFLGSGALLIGAALLATWLPARRAARVNPLIALRAE